MMASRLIEGVMEEAGFPLCNGVFVAVAGPSGAGKDTLIDYARSRFEPCSSDVVFVRRVITRHSDGTSEDHDSMSVEAFERARDEGQFACAWQANGLSYGLPARVDETIAAGQVAVANVSRAALPLLRARYDNVLAVLVTAQPEILAERLAARGREKRDDIRERLARNLGYEQPTVDAETVVIDNSGLPEEGGEKFVAALERALAWSAHSNGM